MSDTFKGIVTADGKKRQLPYGNLLDLPSSDPSLTVEGGFADAAVVGKKNKKTDEAIASLKEDLDYKIGKTAVGERELKFTNIGYVNASDGTISSSQDAQNTGFCRIDGVSRIITHVNLSEAGAKIAFYSRNKEYLKDISITDSNYTEIDLDISSDKYTNAKYCIISNYGNNKKMAKLVGAVAPIKVKEEVTQVKEEVTQIKEEVLEVKEELLEDKDLSFSEIGYVNSNGIINSVKLAQNTGYVNIEGYASVAADTNIGSAGFSIAFFDKDKKFVSGIVGRDNSHNYDYSAEIPENVVYVVVSNYGSYNKSAKLIAENNNVKSRLKILEETSITTNDISIKIDDNGNVFNKNSVVVGKEVYADGSIRNESNSAISDYIPVYGKKMIFLNNLPVYSGLGHYSRFYDENKNPIGKNINSACTLSQFSVKVPTNAHFFVFSVYQRWTNGSKDYSNVVVSFDGYQEYSEYSEIVKSIKGYKIPQKAINNVKTTDKKMLVFGDSITETASMDDDGSNYTEGVRTNWMTFANIMLNTANFKNYAKSGAGWHDRSGLVFRQNVSEQIQLAINDSANDDAEIIVCSLGTNDVSAGSSTYEEAMNKTSIDSLDRAKLYEGIRWAMWTLKNKYPNAVCFCATPIQKASAEQESSLIEAITKMAHRYNFIVIDAYNESGIVRDFETVNANGRYLYDGLHPNEDGAKKMAKLYANVILRNFIVD